MVVGTCRITLAIPETESLKGKRSVVRRVIARVRATFNVAIAEVDDLDAHDTAVLGFAVVGNDHRFVNQVLDKVVDHIEGLHLAEVEDHAFEILHL
ncbi:MAG TPA: DUF503 domain-containing protein [Myxococcota bacterium]|jgi:uncharacterized protein YlxP (DUF503 family)|nr:DUF503 domain-containing protein [Myxococcota bacterium]